MGAQTADTARCFQEIYQSEVKCSKEVRKAVKVEVYVEVDTQRKK